MKYIESLKAFLDHILDYAGLFPPASLSLNESFKNYLDYLRSPYRWMLGKFICPAKLLPELEKLIETSNTNLSIPISVVISEDISELNLVDDFTNKKIAHAKIETLEFRRNQLNLGDFSRLNIRNIFIEFPPEHNIHEAIKTITSVSEGAISVGFKLRTGGTEPSAFPSSDRIAQAITLCRANSLKIKCTAGLHHPIRHFSSEINTKMHGFLNVFAAGVLAYTQGLNEEQLQEILNDESPQNFIFSETGFSWKGYLVSVEEISRARKNFIISFGSCSFGEPLNDLKSLNLI